MTRTRFLAIFIAVTTFTLLAAQTAAAFLFNDLSGTVYIDAIKFLESKGLVEGYDLPKFLPPGFSAEARAIYKQFKPLGNITRAEFIKIIVEARFDDQTTNRCLGFGFRDTPPSAWFAKHLCVAKQHNIIAGYPDATFRPGNNINFLEAAKILVTAFDLPVEKTNPWYKGYLDTLEERNAIPPTITALQNPLRRDEMAELFYRLMTDKRNLPSVTQKQIAALGKTREAKILPYPLPKTLHCLNYENRDKPECALYYKEPACPAYPLPEGISCSRMSKCPDDIRPVCGKDRISYPNACLAQLNGAETASSGWCPELSKFFSDLWLTKKYAYENFSVPSPHIGFTFASGGRAAQGDKAGVWFRSVLNQGSHRYYEFDFNVSANQYGKDISNKAVTRGPTNYYLTSFGHMAKTLIVYIAYDDLFEEKDLKDWTKQYSGLLNDYLAKTQKIIKPLQLKVTPVVIEPPPGITLQKLGKPGQPADIFNKTRMTIFDAALKKIGKNRSDFDLLVFAPVSLENITFPHGSASGWEDTLYKKEILNYAMFWLLLTKNPDLAVTHEEERLETLMAFQNFFQTFSHELWHNIGWSGDHMPSTGSDEYYDGQENLCLFRDRLPFYYYAELPEELAIKVGEEPSWFTMTRDGNCVEHAGTYYKDHDNDGDYEIEFTFAALNNEFEKLFGWIDMDNDGIAEIKDPSPYGGWINLGHKEKQPYELTGGVGLPTFDTGIPEGWYKWPNHVGSEDTETSMSFEPLEKETHGNCLFEKIRLEDGFEGLLPLRCKEFNNDVVNVYPFVRYYWYFFKKDYGVVLLPRTL